MCQRSNVIDGTGDTPTPPSDPKEKKPKQVVVVLHHGLEDSVGGHSVLEPVKNQLITDLADKKNVTVIAPPRPFVFTVSVQQQVVDLYTALQADHKDSDLIIYGHSQGAVIAASLWCQYKEKLKIKGLILDRGPLAGFEILNATKKAKTREFRRKLLTTNYLTEVMDMHQNFQNILDHLFSPGIKDLSPDSVVIQNIVAKLPTIDIPVLIIAAESKYFLSRLYENLITALNTMYSFIEYHFGQGESIDTWFGPKNDGLISQRSQKLNDLDTTNSNVEIAVCVEKSATKVGGYWQTPFLHGLLINDPIMKNSYDKLVEKVKSCISS